MHYNFLFIRTDVQQSRTHKPVNVLSAQESRKWCMPERFELIFKIVSHFDYLPARFGRKKLVLCRFIWIEINFWCSMLLRCFHWNSNFSLIPHNFLQFINIANAEKKPFFFKTFIFLKIQSFKYFKYSNIHKKVKTLRNTRIWFENP